MPARLPPSPIGDEQLRLATLTIVRDSLRPLAVGVAFVMSFVASSYFWKGAPNWSSPLLWADCGSALALLALAAVVGRFQLPERLVYPTLVVIGAIALADTELQIYWTGSNLDSTNFALLIIGTGLVSLSAVWSAIFIGSSWLAWLAIALFIYPDADWIHYGFFLLWSTALAVVVQAVRKRLVWRLLQAEARHQMLVEHLPAISYVRSGRPVRKPLYISPQVEQMLGYTPTEWLAGEAFWIDHLYPPDREAAIASIQGHEVDEPSWDVEYRFVTRDGHVVWLHDRAARFEVDARQQPLVYGTLVDISHRKRVEALRTGGNRVFEELASGAALPEVMRVLVEACEEIQIGAAGAILRREADDTFHYLAAPHLPESFRLATDGMNRQEMGLSNATQTIDIVHEPAAIDVPDGGRYQEALRAAGLVALHVHPIVSSTGKHWGLFIMYFKAPGEPHPFDSELMQTAARLAALAMEKAQAEDALAQHRENLERQVAERSRQLQTSLDQLRHSERLAAVGTLAAGIAHEINNPVGMILLSAEQSLSHAAETRRAELAVPYLQDIVGNAKRCGQVVRSVLRFARRNEPAQRWLADVNGIVREAVELTRAYAARRSGSIETQLAADLPPIRLNPLEVEQVLVNLIRNGIESNVEVPRVRVATEVDGDLVRICVDDNGRGVRVEDLGRIFDPFFTTRHAEGGTGLGLSLAYDIIADQGGTIRVDTSESRGTRMIVELPIDSHCAATGSD